MDKWNVEQITLREFREEQKKSYIVQFKETYEMLHYYIAEKKRKRQYPQSLNSVVENNPLDKSSEISACSKE